MVRQEVVDYIQSLNVAPGTTQRGRCPRCNVRGSFAVTNQDGRLMWVCFRAACEERGGIYKKNLTETEVSDIVTRSKPQKYASLHIQNEESAFKILQMVHYKASSEAAFLLERHGCLKAVDEGRMHVGYDVKLNRLVVLNIIDKSIIVDAIGRSLTNPPQNPKWFRYGNSSVPFVIPAKHDVLLREERAEIIIVEDALSGGLCSEVRDTLVLMGTNLTDANLKFISDNYDRCFLLLDPGAEDKEIKLLKQLDPWVEAFCHFLKDDPKDMKSKDINELITMYKGEKLKKTPKITKKKAPPKTTKKTYTEVTAEFIADFYSIHKKTLMDASAFMDVCINNEPRDDIPSIIRAGHYGILKTLADYVVEVGTKNNKKPSTKRKLQ